MYNYELIMQIISCLIGTCSQRGVSTFHLLHYMFLSTPYNSTITKKQTIRMHQCMAFGTALVLTKSSAFHFVALELAFQLFVLSVSQRHFRS